MTKKKSSISEISLFTVGELVIVGLTIGGFFLLSLLDVVVFNITVVLGALLGFAAIVINYAALCISVNRAVNNFIELRGNTEMSDDESQQFAKEHAAPIQNAMKSSMIFRTFSLMAALIVAFLTGLFNPLATAIPMLAFRPLISVLEFVRIKYDKPPNPDNFIKYEYDDENKEEKESD